LSTGSELGRFCTAKLDLTALDQNAISAEGLDRIEMTTDFQTILQWKVKNMKQLQQASYKATVLA